METSLCVFTKVSYYINTVVQSIFSLLIFYKFTQNLVTCKMYILVIVICLLLVGVDCVADKSKLE